MLDLFQEKDTRKGRQQFLDRLDEWVRSEKDTPGIEGATVADRVKRGWFWGAEDFKESLLKIYKKQRQEKGKKAKGLNRTYRVSSMAKDHGLSHAHAILEHAKKYFRLSEEKLVVPVRGDITRAAIADRVFRETSVSQEWIAEKLGMKSAPNVCQQIRRYRGLSPEQLPPKVRKWEKVKIF